MREASETVPREVAPHVWVLACRTPTLPPATHTNSYLIGSGQCVLIEPAPNDPAEQERLVAWVEDAREHGKEPVAIIATHHHDDHVGGASALRRRLALPLWAHRETADRMKAPVDRYLEEGCAVELDGPEPMVLQAVFTPGHAPGHLCFFETRSGAMVVGDMVASVGTIIVEPGDGDMTAYLASLERMRSFDATQLLPAHGEPIADAESHLVSYIKHRMMREAKVEAALASKSEATSRELVPLAYDDAPPTVWPLATLSTEAHLIKLEREGRAERLPEGRWRPPHRG